MLEVPRISVPFGTTSLSVPVAREAVIHTARAPHRPVDAVSLVGAALEGRAPRRPLIVLPDRTRWAHTDRLLPALLDRLVETAVGPPRVIFASGTHTPMAPDEMQALCAPVAGQVVQIAHQADGERWTHLGVLPGGGRAEVNPAVDDADLVIVISAMTFHYLAGLGGGRKMLVPGLASRATATAVHGTTVSSDPPGRRAGIGPGPLGANPMHQAVLRAVESDHDVVGICVVPSKEGPLDATAGPLLAHHQALAARFVEGRTVTCPLARAALISAGGQPRDTNLIQAHKALVTVAPVLDEGARVALVAACGRGLGHPQLGTWLRQPADALLEALLDHFDISLQTAWSLRSLFERFDVGLRSSLPPDEVRAFGATPLETDEAAGQFLDVADAPVQVFADGASLRYVLSSETSETSKR